jgi:flagellar basal body-associated protein FliL
MKKFYWIIILVLVVLFAVVFNIRFFSGEDNWVCKDGQWVKHGVPEEPMPATECK